MINEDIVTGMVNALIKIGSFGVSGRWQNLR
jgi:hypothetical protein